MSINSRNDPNKRDYEKELNDLKIEYIRFLKDSNDLDAIFQKKAAELQLKIDDAEKEKTFWQERVVQIE